MIENEYLSPEQCVTMNDVRKAVDETDRQLAALLKKRFEYMDAAARIKQDRSAVRDEERKAQVISNIVSEAARLGMPQQLIADIWELLVEGSIAYEFDAWDEKRA